jgi:UDP-N-acetylmuramate dehydrogenase
MGETAVVETGAPLYSVFVAALQSGLSGLEFAVGIPGTVGGALVSNAGAYRHSIGDLVSGLEVIRSGELCTAPPDWMDFGYRDTRLRRQVTNDILARVTLRLVPGSHRDIRARAADYQRQRIRRQPWYPSCGSFFKNITDRRLAESLPELGAELRDAGVVPAGLLIASTGCKALAVGGAQISGRHANFIVNRGGASASDVRRLADTVRSRVFDRYGVALTEEVLYIGDWRDWPSTSC